jgi:hypothetical protein
MNPHEHQDLSGRLLDQLPRALRNRLRVWILPGPFGELPTAFYSAGDREFSFQIQEDGLLSERDLAHLCAVL